MISKLKWNNKNVKYINISRDVLMWWYTLNGDAQHECDAAQAAVWISQLTVMRFRSSHTQLIKYRYVN